MGGAWDVVGVYAEEDMLVGEERGSDSASLHRLCSVRMAAWRRSRSPTLATPISFMCAWSRRKSAVPSMSLRSNSGTYCPRLDRRRNSDTSCGVQERTVLNVTGSAGGGFGRRAAGAPAALAPAAGAGYAWP